LLLSALTCGPLAEVGVVGAAATVVLVLESVAGVDVVDPLVSAVVDVVVGSAVVDVVELTVVSVVEVVESALGTDTPTVDSPSDTAD
jgi:hypothetical protein